MTGPRGFTLIEVIVVMAIIAISVGLAGPRIGAGISRLELNQATQIVRTAVRLARIEAQRTDKEQYVVLDQTREVVSLVNSDLIVSHQDSLPRSVSFVLDSPEQEATLHVSPAGIVRGGLVRLRGRSGEVEVSFR